ncbi:MAG: hypothetical protein MUF29_04135 [Chitinophagaceae bacterium]|nr:hypothetical protein [Chitinophagaceae bacterium]
MILVLLLLNVYRHATAGAQPYGDKDRKLGLWLMISSHIMLLLGLVQYFFGGVGLSRIKDMGMGEVMKNSEMRYWAVEHISTMLISIVLITIAYGVRKKQMDDISKHRRALLLYALALLLILAAMPWPGRQGDIGRSFLPGM